MKLDLRKDYQGILKHIKERVQDDPVDINIGPGDDDDPESQITLGYAFVQSGWISLVFDTRPGADSDGEDGHWQSFIDETEHELQHWRRIITLRPKPRYSAAFDTQQSVVYDPKRPAARSWALAASDSDRHFGIKPTAPVMFAASRHFPQHTRTVGASGPGCQPRIQIVPAGLGTRPSFQGV